ncbi:hypothetical protein [Streptomyces goshikiensis]|uniref:hypothetical protein n=1 Tax=Streptomyces goshikiensis TaxID=1942 RepID=UPI0036D0F2AC
MTDKPPSDGPVTYVAMRNGQPTNTALTLETAQNEALQAEQRDDGGRYDYQWVEQRPGNWRLMRKPKSKRVLPAVRTARTVAAVPLLPGPPASAQPSLSVRLRADWLAGILRADAVRRDTLLFLATAWGSDEGREDLILQLDALAEALQAPAEGELDHLLEAVEGAAGMDDAEICIDLTTALRIQAENDALIGKLGRFNPAAIARPVILPSQQDRRAS